MLPSATNSYDALNHPHTASSYLKLEVSNYIFGGFVNKVEIDMSQCVCMCVSTIQVFANYMLIKSSYVVMESMISSLWLIINISLEEESS